MALSGRSRPTRRLAMARLGNIMVFVGQIKFKKSNSQKGSEGAQVLILMNFFLWIGLLVEWLTIAFLFSADRQIFQQALGSNLWVGIPFYPVFCLFQRQYFAACSTKLFGNVTIAGVYILLPFNLRRAMLCILFWVNKHILL